VQDICEYNSKFEKSTKTPNFFRSLTTVSFSRKTLHHISHVVTLVWTGFKLWGRDYLVFLLFVRSADFSWPILFPQYN